MTDAEFLLLGLALVIWFTSASIWWVARSDVHSWEAGLLQRYRQFRRHLLLKVAIATGKYEAWPSYNRWLAGVHVAAWSRCCGWSWGRSLRDAMGYWKWR